MDALGVVVKDGQSNGFVKPGQIFVPVHVAELQLETAKPALHVAVLPRTGSFATAQGYLHALAQLLVFVAQVLRALVGVQDGWAWMFAQGVQHSSELTLAAVPSAKAPANNLPGLQIEHNRQAVLFAHEPEMGEVLHPSTRVGHGSVGLACLWPLPVTKHCKVFQGIWCRAAAPLLARDGNGNASEGTDTPGFLLAPAKMQREPADAVKRVLGVCGEQCSNILRILGVLLSRGAVVARPADSQNSGESFPPSRLDFFQDS